MCVPKTSVLPRLMRFESRNILLFLLIWILGSCPLKAQELTVEHAVDSLDGAMQSLKSWDVHAQCTTRFYIKEDSHIERSEGKRRKVIKSKRKIANGEKVDVLIASYRQMYQGGKGRIEFMRSDDGKQSVGGQPTVVVYDGEMQKSFNANAKQCTIGIPQQNIVPGDGSDYLHLYRNVHAHLPILNSLRERKNVVCKSLDANSVSLETAPCPKVRVDYPGFGFRVVLDKGHGFMPKVIERTKLLEGKEFTERRTRITEWKSLGGGIWAPLKAVTEYFDSDPNWPTFGALAVEETLVIDVTRSSWNQDIPEEMFNLRLPVGTTVIDTLRQVKFVTGQADPGKNLSDLAAHAKRTVPYPFPHPPPDLTPWWKSWWLRGAFGMLIVGFAFFVITRYRRRKAGSIA